MSLLFACNLVPCSGYSGVCFSPFIRDVAVGFSPVSDLLSCPWWVPTGRGHVWFDSTEPVWFNSTFSFHLFTFSPFLGSRWLWTCVVRFHRTCRNPELMQYKVHGSSTPPSSSRSLCVCATPSRTGSTLVLVKQVL